MKKRLLVATCALSVMILSGCGMFVSQEAMDTVIAERDYFMEEYDAAVEEQASYETEVEDLEQQITDLEDEKEALSSEITDLEAQIEELLKESLEDFFNDNPQVTSAMDAQVEAYLEDDSSVYSDLGWEVEGNTLTYWYQLREQVADPDTAWNSLSATLDKDQLADLVEGLEEETGVEGITLQYVYYNADGTVIGSIAWPEQ